MSSQRIRSISGCKMVRFTDHLVEYCEKEPDYVLTMDLIEDIWWQPEDFHAFKVSAKVLADEAIEKGICRYLDRNYGFTDDKTQNALNLWAKCRVTRRGLERFINKEYAQRRLDVRRRTIHAVLYAQEQMHEEIECGDINRAVEVIRKVAVTVSAQCQTFAYMMAKADASAGALRVRKRQKSVVQRQNVSDVTEPSFQNASVTSQASAGTATTATVTVTTAGSSSTGGSGDSSSSSRRVRPTSAQRRRVRRSRSDSSTASASSSHSAGTTAAADNDDENDDGSTHTSSHDNIDDAASVPSVLTNVTDISKPRARSSSKSRRLPPSRNRSSKRSSSKSGTLEAMARSQRKAMEASKAKPSAATNPSSSTTKGRSDSNTETIETPSQAASLPPTSPTDGSTRLVLPPPSSPQLGSKNKASVKKFLPPASPAMSQSTQPVSVCSDSSGNSRRNLPTIIQF